MREAGTGGGVRPNIKKERCFLQRGHRCFHKLGGHVIIEALCKKVSGIGSAMEKSLVEVEPDDGVLSSVAEFQRRSL